MHLSAKYALIVRPKDGMYVSTVAFKIMSPFAVATRLGTPRLETLEFGSKTNAVLRTV